jgi:hypothetical protein
MLRSTLTAFGFAASLFAFASLDAIGEPVLHAALAVALGVAVTALAYGQLAFVAVTLGALSPLALALLEKHSMVLAVAALSFAWLLPRFLLADGRKLLYLAVASLGAALVTGFVVAGYVDAGWAAQVAACVFAGSCLSLVGLVPTETGIAWALRAAAAVIDSPARPALERAARAHASRDRRASKGTSWRALARLADQRAAMERGEKRDDDARKDLDDRIVTLAEELAPTAVSTTGAVTATAATTATAAATEVATANEVPPTVTERPADAPVDVSFDVDAQDQAETAAE